MGLKWLSVELATVSNILGFGLCATVVHCNVYGFHMALSENDSQSTLC